MAKFEKTVNLPLFQTVSKVENAVLNGSMTASLEESSDFATGTARVAVRVFERYSFLGSNRVSMSVTMVSAGTGTHICAVTAGGSQAMFWKINTVGEESFLDTLREAFE